MEEKDKDDDNEVIKIGCFGESSVGKTCLSRRFVDDNNFDFSIPTIGIEHFTKMLILSDGQKYKIKIYDTAGQERYRSLCMNSIRPCDGIILMYDITNRETFDLLFRNWINNIYEIKKEDFPLIIIGNKCDLEDKREISKEEGLKAANQYKTLFFETSAKEGINYKKPFEELLNKIIIQKKEKSKNKKKNNNLKLDKKSNRKKKHKGC